jgi:hypothetical protein
MVRYLVILSAVVGLAWLAVAVPIGDRPLYGHLTHGRPAAWWASTKRFFVELWPKDAPPTKPEKKPKRRIADVPKKAPPIQTDKGATRRVALLGEAAKQVEKAPSSVVAAKPAAAKPVAAKPVKARIDERISPGNKKALDALVANREARR